MAGNELKIERIIKSTPDRIWRAWTTPELLEKWFCPKPWHVKVHSLDLRVGGSSDMTMHGPNGEVYPNRGVYLCLETNHRLIFTDAFINDWIPSERAWFVGEIILEDLGDGTTKYTAYARHWTNEAKEEHEKMGFYDGWNAAANQLEELLQEL